jgi:hypothetical protein
VFLMFMIECTMGKVFARLVICNLKSMVVIEPECFTDGRKVVMK